jgi:hemoglobin-like flavoprotein
MFPRRADGFRFSRLRRAFLAVLAMAAVATIAFHAPGALAQQALPQIQLTAKQIDQYIAAFKELTPLFEKLDQAQGKPDAKLMAAVNAAVKKYGFKDLDEYDQVVVSIVAVLDGIDPKTRQYSNPIDAIKKEIAAVQADKAMKPDERKKALESLNAELSEVQPVQHPANIELVLKYFDKLNAVAQ